MIRVYGASRTTLASEWLRLREAWPEVEWTARWPFLIGEVPDEPAFAKLFWQHDLEDVAKADVVMVLSDANDPDESAALRGALVEAGAGLALGKSLVLVGDCWEFGTWQYHPRCYKVACLLEARVMLKQLTPESAGKLRIRMPRDLPDAAPGWSNLAGFETP